MGTKPGDDSSPKAPDAGRKGTNPELPAQPQKPSNPNLAAVPARKTNPELVAPHKGDKYTKHSDDNRALGDNMGGITGSHKVVTGETAPEVSQGAWRERAFIPRAIMARPEMLA